MKSAKNFNLLACAAAALLLTAAPATAQLQVVDRVAAIVDEDVVMQSELEQRLSDIYAQIESSGGNPPPLNLLAEQVLERLISERLQLNLGNRAGVRISEEEINQAIARLAASSGGTVEAYIAAVEQQSGGYAGLREQIRTEMVLRRVQQGNVMRRIRISDRELDNFLNSQEGQLLSAAEVRVGHILLSLNAQMDAEQQQQLRDRATELAAQAAQGSDFAALALSYSNDSSAAQGGDLGWRNSAELPELFAAALAELQPGEVSAVLQSGAGLHILKLYDRRGGGEQLVEQHFARHFLLSPNQIRDPEQTVAELEGLRQRLIDGEDFAALAREYSEDKGSALSGGELGWSTPGMFVPEFERTMNNIAIGEISAPFKSQFGWHILQVTERRDQDFSTEILRNRARNLLSQRKFDAELQVWLQEIRDEAFVQIKSIPGLLESDTSAP
jgi:peptidyl-prolyl cis-trans isomerase SurA